MLVKKYLEKKDQVLFFLNRRGYAPFMICKACGSKLDCPNCSIFLTFHKHINKAMCHHCGYKSSINSKCIKTDQSCDYQMYGPGVEKIYAELKQIFPEKILRVDSLVCCTKGTHWRKKGQKSTRAYSPFCNV